MRTVRLSALFITTFLLLVQVVPTAIAQSCRWAGTAPICSGECGGNETEITRLDEVPSHWVPPFANVNPSFGAACLTGTKALCCTQVQGSVCRWDGTAPFCEGSCKAGETKGQPADGSSSGAACLTGAKAYCCRSIGANLGRTGARLAAETTEDVIYAVAANGDLDWFRHIGREEGTFQWASNEARKVGVGWEPKHLFSGGDGIIYVVTKNGDLMWYRHESRVDGSFLWESENGKKVGTGWNAKHIFSGGDGVIYAVMANNDLLWFRHDGQNDGSFKWAFSEGKKVGVGWDVKQVFSSGDGIIYAQMKNNDLLWYRHDGRRDGDFKWGFPDGKRVGIGWDFIQLFTGAALAK